MKATANKIKSLLEAGKETIEVTLYGKGDFYAKVQFAQTANEDGRYFFWVRIDDYENMDGYYARQESWKAAVAYLKEYSIDFMDAEIKKIA